MPFLGRFDTATSKFDVSHASDQRSWEQKGGLLGVRKESLVLEPSVVPKVSHFPANILTLNLPISCYTVGRRDIFREFLSATYIYPKTR